MTLLDLSGYAAAVSVFAAFWMKTMIPLRVAGIVGNLLFICWGFFGEHYPVLALHIILLPLNLLRLYQMLQLIKRVAAASTSDLSLDWLKPFMSARQYRKGNVLFRKGDAANE